jgi:hypothetical protein
MRLYFCFPGGNARDFKTDGKTPEARAVYYKARNG